MEEETISRAVIEPIRFVEDNPQPGTAKPNSQEGAGDGWQAALGSNYANYRDLLQAKGWRGPEDALRSYQNLERVLGGANKIALPREDASGEEWESLYSALGRPEKPEGYAFEQPQGFDAYAKDLANDFASAAHQAGLNGKQARQLHDWWVKRAGPEGASERMAAQEAELQGAMQKTWGARKAEKLSLARRAAVRFGFSSQQVDRLGTLLGDMAAIDGFARIGENLVEDRMTGQGGGGAMGPAGARAELERAMTDQEFRQALFTRGHPGHDAAVQRFRRLASDSDPNAVVKVRG